MKHEIDVLLEEERQKQQRATTTSKEGDDDADEDGDDYEELPIECQVIVSEKDKDPLEFA